MIRLEALVRTSEIKLRTTLNATYKQGFADLQKPSPRPRMIPSANPLGGAGEPKD